MSENANDEIDLLELVEIIWGAKRVIGLVTSAFGALGIAIVLFLPSNFKGELRFSALDATQMAAYATLNDTPGISTPIYAGPEIIGQTGVVLSDNLLASMLSEVSTGRVFAATHAKLDPGIINFEGTEEEVRDKLSRTAKTYRFSFEEGSNTSGSISFETADKNLARIILDAGFKLMNEKIRGDNLIAITALENSIKTRLFFEIEEVESAIETALQNYETNTQARLARLGENAAIARNLGLTENQSGQTNGNMTNIDVRVNNKAPLYLRGYKALEKEIQLIKARGQGRQLLPFVDIYPELAANLRQLKSDMRLKRIQAGVQASPLVEKDQFAAANVDLENIIFESASNKNLIVILITFLGGIIAVIVVILRHFMAQRFKTA